MKKLLSLKETSILNVEIDLLKSVMIWTRHLSLKKIQEASWNAPHRQKYAYSGGSSPTIHLYLFLS